MNIDEQTVKTIARLARLELKDVAASQQDLDKIVDEFSKIVGYMDILGEADTSGVEPLYSPMFDPQPPRSDVARTGEGLANEILEQAPEKVGRFFSVPRIV
ncbi:MAG: Asp-tRNA(Asn)/Glu-tRNA(Gln) amidotransferase subunit GatC [Deltaproteobacteria bacterium]|nr:Asp-tRNA(Asn)/Glu-tRNA(Gln) amidotransferase subunit GatC [Deltaproteobacteria bacterium]